MLDLFLCNLNISCHLRNVTDQFSRSKYPSEYAEVCKYYEENKIELPEYCKWDIKQPRKRNEF
jgi:hypothetical protein